MRPCTHLVVFTLLVTGALACSDAADPPTTTVPGVQTDVSEAPDVPTTPDAGPNEEVASCTPLTCEALGVSCGAPTDGCGDTLTCGSCGESEACDGSACVPSLCAGYCGLGAGGAEPGVDEADCWCDAECFEIGDCCDNICLSCGDAFGQYCCTPSCGMNVCGDDGCGGSCGSCDAGLSCEAGQCVACEAQCEGKACGDDGCGGSCGTCGDDSQCVDGQCEGCEGSCLPEITITTPPSPFVDYFAKMVDVFGVRLYATSGVSDAKLLHAAHVMAQYLDNDEDGLVDNATAHGAMVNAPGGAALVMFASENELESSGIFNAPLQGTFQDLYANETHPQGSGSHGFDATLEEVLHLVTHAGYSRAYPGIFGEYPGSAIADAMDLARGGQFMSIPPSYPDEAWYHYDDSTCDYGCMVTEYFYWGLTSLLGAQDYRGRCENIAVEWEACTTALMESMDPGLTALLKDPAYSLPTVIPDGSYGD